MTAIRAQQPPSATGAWLESHPDLAADVGQASSGLPELDVSCHGLIAASWGGESIDGRMVDLVKAVFVDRSRDMDLVRYVCVNQSMNHRHALRALAWVASGPFPAVLLQQLGPGLPGLHAALASDLLAGLSGSVVTDVRRVAMSAYVQWTLGDPEARDGRAGRPWGPAPQAPGGIDVDDLTDPHARGNK